MAGPSIDSNQDILPLAELEKGMTGYGKTTVSGTEIEEFDVEILGVLEEQSSNQDLILIEVSGELIEETGGIAAGMSGSPIYVEGKLIGAIGYGWQLTDHKLGLVTPIESMLDIWELDIDVDNKVAQLVEAVELDDRTVEQVKFIDSHEKKEESSATDEESLLAYPVQTPLLVSGLEKPALKHLDNQLEDYDLKPIQTGSASSQGEEEAELAPGSAVALQLVKGDIDIAAIGTLTYLEDEQFLGFGHPFMSKGSSNYFFSSAYIHHVVDSLDMPFKLGAPMDLKGIATQDRRAGVSGLLGEYPRVVPVEVLVKDKDMNRDQQIDTQLIRDEDLLSALAGTVVYQSIYNTMDRAGGGTAKVKMEIMGNNLEEGIIKRENMFYNRHDVASVALDDFLEALMLITYNPFKKVDLVSIELDIEVEEEPQVALIDEVKVLEDEIKPGDEIEIEVTFMPYRRETITKNYTLELPEDIEPGVVSMELIGGQEANYAQYGQEGEPHQETEYGEGRSDTFKSLEEVLTAFEKQKINNDLVIRIMPDYIPESGSPAAVEEEQAAEEVEPNNYNDDIPDDDLPAEAEEGPHGVHEGFTIDDLIEETFRTEYILEGRVHTKLNIKAGENNGS
ncbi:SpoIVB peptidase S55 [Fuchsiella alkaliacetigena]|nr:SpoIVB peptidase S55 [Fuchsiella alkaliacetigena]